MSLPRRYGPATGMAPSGAGRFKGVTTIGFQAGAANTFKMWPAGYFSALADRLAENMDDVLIVITGSPGEHALGEEIIRGCRSANIRNACGAFRIEELPALIRGFDLLVSNDTGTMHLAIALGTPTLCLFGATSSGLIGPFQDLDKHRVIQKIHESSAHIPKKKRSNAAMKQITVDEVHAAAIEMLAQRAETGCTKV
jgi:ADP-heptose:LPS heptosyltransferase